MIKVRNQTRASVILLATTALSITGTTAVFAQTQNAQSGGIEEIVVTATRREESLSKVAISVTAVTADELSSRQIVRADDLLRQTPGVTFTGSSTSTSNLSIRGVLSSTGAATTAIYVDDTPIQIRVSGATSTRPFYPELVDLERVEVLRGPQGTLFGAGAEGGAVRFINRDVNLQQFHMSAKSDIRTALLRISAKSK